MLKPTEDYCDIMFNTSPLKVGEKLEPPNEKELMKEPVFWRAPFEEVMKLGGEYTKYLLQRLQKTLSEDERKVTVDLKIQAFKKGDYPTERSACFWHIDGPINVPEIYCKMLGVPGLLDIATSRAVRSARMFMYHTQPKCATDFINESNITLNIPKCISGFEPLAKIVNAKIATGELSVIKQEAYRMYEVNSSHLHRSAIAEDDCVRLWLRVTQCDYTRVRRNLPINSTWSHDKSVIETFNAF